MFVPTWVSMVITSVYIGNMCESPRNLSISLTVYQLLYTLSYIFIMVINVINIRYLSFYIIITKLDNNGTVTSPLVWEGVLCLGKLKSKKTRWTLNFWSLQTLRKFTEYALCLRVTKFTNYCQISHQINSILKICFLTQ